MGKQVTPKVKVNPAYRELVPPLSTEEFEDLKADIKANGIVDKIVVDDQGNILDGHHRFKCDKNAPFRVLPGVRTMSEEEKQAYVIRRNINRRNLSPEQKREVGLRRRKLAWQLYASDSERWTQQAIAEAIGVSQTTIDRWSKEDEWETISITRAGKAYNPTPAKVNDKRLKLSPDEKTEIAAALDAGTTQAQVAADHGISQPRVSQIVKEEERRESPVFVEPKPLPAGQYNLLYADPPWRYEHVKTDTRKIENQYPTMELMEICALGISEFAAKDCMLFLWATAPKLAEAMQVIVAWGFIYRTCMVWVKDKIGMGYYARQRSELLLIATKGSPGVPDTKNRPDSVIEAPRGKHSEKPACVYETIERMYPDAKRVELFCRKARKGWGSWGNQET